MPVAPYIHTFFLVIGPIGSVRTECCAPVSTINWTGLPSNFVVTLGSGPIPFSRSLLYPWSPSHGEVASCVFPSWGALSCLMTWFLTIGTLVFLQRGPVPVGGRHTLVSSQLPHSCLYFSGSEIVAARTSLVMSHVCLSSAAVTDNLWFLFSAAFILSHRSFSFFFLAPNLTCLSSRVSVDIYLSCYFQKFR